ncbi:hypothetical protein GCM10025762_33120 [Haloechinothrix salitolerans]
MLVDPEDTTQCPLSDCCEGCRSVEDLSVVAVEIQSGTGMMCATLCGTCIDADRTPVIVSWTKSSKRVAEHCGHLSITEEDMTMAMTERSVGGR